MSRTTRSIPIRRWLRQPQTLSQKKMEQKAFEEINDEFTCHHNRLRRNSNPANIVSAWDDLFISGVDQTWSV